MTKELKKEEDWKKLLSDEQYRVMRQHGTERPGSSPLNFENRTGKYFCVACGNHLFTSDSKFDAGCGWPSFYQTVASEAVSEHVDHSYFMTRTEIRCANCGSHLGHVFDDGPMPTGLRYCMNGVALQFEPEED
ncbi:peptide-methionine (R)-S-oxide reductase MsrB [uncultured Cohaesibacter sp.]|uniref:peptide-methionine (R)-S-oxide reductase MsrB n=1 Tax=uncultured Cohaesibacter sp. TaxID=1002546 RepID=UPI0029C6F8CD|nr:peptide-methionine (R)-S-oxide reductase MsrB [uncultured Cohaesibacter sp.]